MVVKKKRIKVKFICQRQKWVEYVKGSHVYTDFYSLVELLKNINLHKGYEVDKLKHT